MKEGKQTQKNTVDIEKLYNHAKIANEEMGVIKNDMLWVKSKLQDFETRFESRFDKLDNRVWLIISSIVLGLLIQITLKLWK